MKKEFKSIHYKEFNTNIFKLWEDQWFLLTCGDFKTGDFNTMTVAWGSLGIMWSVPFAQAVVRPTRHTFGFMNKYSDFTLCAFPKKYQKDLSWLGTHSGRDGDKIAHTSLTPCASHKILSPSFEEADLIIECEKMYEQDMDPSKFLHDFIHTKYKENDHHRIYFGKIVNIFSS